MRLVRDTGRSYLPGTGPVGQEGCSQTWFARRAIWRGACCPLLSPWDTVRRSFTGSLVPLGSVQRVAGERYLGVEGMLSVRTWTARLVSEWRG
jgi:hypothetical protein